MSILWAYAIVTGSAFKFVRTCYFCEREIALWQAPVGSDLPDVAKAMSGQVQAH